MRPRAAAGWSCALRTRPPAPSIRARSCRACTGASAAWRATASGSLPCDEVRHPRGDLLAFARLARDRGQRGLERVGRRLAVAALALLVEMHRRRVQQHRHRRRLRRRRLRRRSTRARGRRSRTRPRSLASHRNAGIEVGGELLAFAHHFAGAGRGEAQEHVAGLDLHALAGHRLDLQRRVLIGEHGTGLELAVVLEQHVHGKCGPLRGEDRAEIGMVRAIIMAAMDYIRTWRQRAHGFAALPRHHDVRRPHRRRDVRAHHRGRARGRASTSSTPPTSTPKARPSASSGRRSRRIGGTGSSPPSAAT